MFSENIMKKLSVFDNNGRRHFFFRVQFRLTVRPTYYTEESKKILNVIRHVGIICISRSKTENKMMIVFSSHPYHRHETSAIHKCKDRWVPNVYFTVHTHNIIWYYNTVIIIIVFSLSVCVIKPFHYALCAATEE